MNISSVEISNKTEFNMLNDGISGGGNTGISLST